MGKKRHGSPDRRVKRLFDLLFCLCSLPVALPIGFIIAMLICLDSKGLPIYKHERIGRNGKTFTLYKFRTMVNNADELLDKHLSENPELADEWARTQKLQQDPRVTRVGYLLRKTSLDELPQLLNIILGNMTMVGPRPIVNAEIGKYGKIFEEYCNLDPGLTGLWQVSGRSDTTYERRLACDHYYAHNWSFWLDIKILAKTLPVALKGFGAY